jgi:hypothetical protein
LSFICFLEHEKICPNHNEQEADEKPTQHVFKSASDVEMYLMDKHKIQLHDSCFTVNASYTPIVYTAKDKSNLKLFAQKLGSEILQKWRCSDREKFILFVVYVERAFGFDVGVRSSDGVGPLAKYVYFNCISAKFFLSFFVVFFSSF